MALCRGINSSPGALLLSLLICFLIHSSRMQASAGRKLPGVSASMPSLFTVSVHKEGGGHRRIMLEGEDPPGANTIPKGEHSRLLELEDSVLDADEPEVHLPLFEDLEVVVVWDQNKEPGEIKKLRDLIDDTQELLQPSDRVTLTGGLKGYEQGETMVTFVVSQNSFFGSVMFPWLKENGDVVMRIVQIESLPGESHLGVSYEYFKPDLPMEDIIGPVGANSDEDLDEAQDGAGFATSGVPVIPPVEHDAAKPLEPEPAGSGQHRKLQAITEVDILILYTPAASTAMGGDSASVDKITSMIATTNEIYVNSEVDVRLRLVRVEKVNYFEKPTRPTTLGDLLNGVVPNSARLRSEYGADLIQMVTIDSTYCGIGYAPAVGSLNSRNGLSVVSTKCMTSTSAHEIGHNFGCYHDYYSSNRNDKYNGLSRCELSGSQKFSTVLSYGCQNGAKPQELFFLSNPKVFVNRGGTMFSTGDTQTADCASAHMAGRSTVAAYFPTMGGGGGGGGEGGNGNGQTQTCAGGGSCTSPNVCASFAEKSVCCSQAFPIWCGETTCFTANHICTVSELCPSGAKTCFAPTLCAAFGSKEACCPASAPKWCGGGNCFTGDYECPGDRASPPSPPPPVIGQICPSGSTCKSGTKCVTFDGEETCCSTDVPVWCGGNKCLRAGSICKNPGATDICPSGSFCSDGYVCATFGDDETCCSADYPAWCGGDSCYQRGHVCGLNNICPSGAKCQTSLVCSVYEGDEGCCPPSSPVLCGDELCHAAGYRCPTYKVQCPSGGSCLTPNVCASFGGDDTCCSPNFPVWCGGDMCYKDGYQCPGVKKICPGGGSCTTPKVCSSFEDSSVCCSPNYPTWCGGDICYGQTYKCPNAKVKCPGGAFCTGPKVCASFQGTDTCCSADYPVWCGGDSCYGTGYKCPNAKEYCPNGGYCTGPKVCASWGSQDTCCSASYPVWCGGSSCYASSYTCPSGVREDCDIASKFCTSPRVCSYSGNSLACCPSSYPVWCGGSSCYHQGSSCNRRLLSELGENEAAPALPASGSQEFSFDLGFGDFGSVDSDSGSDSDIDGSEDSIPATPVNTDEVEVAMDAFAQATDVEIYLLMDALVEIAMKSEAVQVDEGEEEEEEELPMGSTSLAQGLLTWPTDSDPAERSESSSVSDEADSLGSIPAKADSLGSVPAEAPTGRVSISADQFIADSSPALDPTPPVMEDRAADATTSPVKVLV